VSELSGPSGSHDGAPQHREFVQAATITDLPGELMSALSQGLSQFGINLPPMPTGLLGGTGVTTPAAVTPGLGTGLGSGLGTGLGAPTLTDPGLANPALTNPGLTSPTGASPALPGLSTPSAAPALTDPALASPGLTTPSLATPSASSALTSPGLTTPPALTTPGLGASPVTPVGLGAGEVPISAPVDPALAGYPVLGDPLAVAQPVAAPSGGLLGDLSSAANQLGAGEAIDLLKGVLMPAIMSAVKPPVPAAPAAAAAPALGAAEAAAPAAAAATGAAEAGA
jgi:hypothetical protein